MPRLVRIATHSVRSLFGAIGKEASVRVFSDEDILVALQRASMDLARVGRQKLGLIATPALPAQ